MLTLVSLLSCHPAQGLRTFEQVDEVEALQEGRRRRGACSANLTSPHPKGSLVSCPPCRAAPSPCCGDALPCSARLDNGSGPPRHPFPSRLQPSARRRRHGCVAPLHAPPKPPALPSPPVSCLQRRSRRSSSSPSAAASARWRWTRGRCRRRWCRWVEGWACRQPDGPTFCVGQVALPACARRYRCAYQPLPEPTADVLTVPCRPWALRMRPPRWASSTACCQRGAATASRCGASEALGWGRPACLPCRGVHQRAALSASLTCITPDAK